MLKNKVWISTVFLGVDYNFMGKGRPILFETMAWDTTIKEKYKLGNTEHESIGEDIYQVRYRTYKEAEAGHKAAIIKFKKYARPTKRGNT